MKTRSDYTEARENLIHSENSVENSKLDNCPVCNSKDIEGRHPEFDRTVASQRLDCNECHSTWVEVYELDCIEDLQIGEDVEKQTELALKLAEMEAVKAVENGDYHELIRNLLLHGCKPLKKESPEYLKGQLQEHEDNEGRKDET